MVDIGSSFFFCGIGGSGMLPLALILKGQGKQISGSDRSYDQGRTPDKFEFIKSQGIDLVPQDGAGMTNDFSALVVSTAVENSIPEVQKARELGVPILKRAELLAMLFNQAQTRIGVGGTSGKSTTTGMIGYVLRQCGKNPTVMNGATFRNFVSEDMPYATALIGTPDVFVSECDESDGSATLFAPNIAVVTNISLDHQPIEKLINIFMTFLSRAKYQIVNLDNEHTPTLIKFLKGGIPLTFGIENETARFVAKDITLQPDGSRCMVWDQEAGVSEPLTLKVPGRHNIENALACIAACVASGLSLKEICRHLSSFQGVRRRMDVIGHARGITVIDDFAHNPDKIAATLATLNEFPGRLLILFQMHGFGPLRLMKSEMIDVFQAYLDPSDVLFMPEVLYLGGTTDMSYTAKDFVKELTANNVNAKWFEKRDAILPEIASIAMPGDRIIVMGARDDSLTEVAKTILSQLGNAAAA